MSFYAKCQFCGPCPVPFDDEVQAQRCAVWHLYEEHPEHWLIIVGQRPPLDPRPDP